MRVICYTYEADLHCPDCAKERFGSTTGDLDEHGIPYDAEDMEKNPLHPVFTYDEMDWDEVCGDCFQPIRY